MPRALPSNDKFGKCFCLVVKGFLIIFTIFLIIKLIGLFTDNPTVFTLDSTSYEIENIEFPAISICNLNKISKRRVKTLARSMSNNSDVPYEEIMQSIQMLGTLHDFEFIKHFSEAEVSKLQDIMDKMGLNIRKAMQFLATPCSELLESCRWKGNDVQCSKLFSSRLTYEGYCCVFNYVRTTPGELFTVCYFKTRRPEQFSSEPLKGKMGVENGLSVVVKNALEDYFYTSISTVGINIHVFVPTDYPDKYSGSLMDAMAAFSAENFVEVLPTTVYAADEVVNYDVRSRECIFDEERITQFGFYSQSNCLVDCRIKNLMALCQCVPFTIPDIGDEEVCTLRDLQCLSQYRTKWMYYQPREENRPSLANQMENYNGQYCPSFCYPSCESTLYNVKFDENPIYKPSDENNSIVHIFLNNRFYKLYKQDVVFYWYEILSYFGGILGIVLGGSLIYLLDVMIRAMKFLLRNKG